ncbi:MAG TPA: pyridoxal phosphate-dependent aminotransferase [Chitinophagaceae bacterium]|nr:pyridoxal phosphate-dependent aminotransferase [Chitinophagaceae bacterium]
MEATPIKLARLLDRFEEPETLKMAKMGRELKAQGADIIDLSLGEPDFDTPQHIKEAAIKAINDNWSHYPPVAGFPDLRAAVCTKLQRDNQLSYQPENIVISTGAKQSLANAIMSLVNEGDEVLIPTPYWVTYSELVKISGGKVVAIKTTAAQQFKITPEQLAKAITEKTKIFLFSSPCNPSGAVYSYEELEALVAVFEKNPQVFIIADEIYEYINYVGRHESIAQFASIKDRVILINGLSKGFAMTGWRLGYMAADAAIAKACEKIQGQFTSGANAMTQKAAVTALTGNLQPTKDMTKSFLERKNRVMELMADIPGITCPEPEGAFYIFPDMHFYFGKKKGNHIINNASDLCMYLLHEAHVSSVMGDAFGEPSCVRFSFANNIEKIEEGWKRIKKALAQLQ